MTDADLAALERVTQKFLDQIHVEFTNPLEVEWKDSIDLETWIGLLKDKPVCEHRSPRIMEFPREQWITYPARRAAVLILADRLLDLYDDLTVEQRTMLAWLMDHGGRERIA